MIFLGIKLLRAGISTQSLTTPDAPDSLWKLFFNTWLVTALNPKGILFFIAFLPQFIDSAKAVAPQLWILSVSFVSLATLNAFLYAQFASSARKLLSSPRAQKRFNITGGSLLSIAGLWALTARQPS